MRPLCFSVSAIFAIFFIDLIITMCSAHLFRFYKNHQIQRILSVISFTFFSTNFSLELILIQLFFCYWVWTITTNPYGKGFCKVNFFLQKIPKKFGYSSTHPPTPHPIFFLESHQWHGQNTQITTFNNVHTEYITLRSYHMSTHSPHWK